MQEVHEVGALVVGVHVLDVSRDEVGPPPGKKCSVIALAHKASIFAWGNRFYGQNPNLGLVGSIYGGREVALFAVTTDSVMAGNFRSIGISDRISIAIA